MPKIYYILLFCLCAATAGAQKLQLSAADTISKQEYVSLKEVTSEGKLFMFDSLSHVSDTNTAAYWLNSINPYYFLYSFGHIDLLNAFLSGYVIKKGASDLCRSEYLKAYNAPKSESYNTFKLMAEEDQMLREKSAVAEDSFTSDYFHRKINSTDSIHFLYLRNYVSQHGWPSLADGSMPASLIAIHDHEFHKYYMPYLKKAIMNGQAEISTLKLLKYWYTLPHYTFEKDYRNNKSYSYDISPLLYDNIPGNTDKIYKTIKRLMSRKDFHVGMVYSSPSIEDYHHWIHAKKSMTGKKSILLEFMKQLDLHNPKASKQYHWYVHYEPSKVQRLRFYIFYK